MAVRGHQAAAGALVIRLEQEQAATGQLLGLWLIGLEFWFGFFLGLGFFGLRFFGLRFFGLRLVGLGFLRLGFFGLEFWFGFFLGLGFFRLWFLELGFDLLFLKLAVFGRRLRNRRLDRRRSGGRRRCRGGLFVGRGCSGFEGPGEVPSEMRSSPSGSGVARA